jgi:hypothetical protein
MPEDLIKPGQGRESTDDAWVYMVRVCLICWLIVFVYAVGAAIWMIVHP